jgi:anti-sigma factor RsiW
MRRYYEMRTDPALSCAEVVELVTDYLEDALAPDTAGRVAAHLADCVGCSVYLDQLRATSAALRGLELSGLPDEACATLLAAFRDWAG